MISNKVVIEGTIVSVGVWHETKKGDRIRDFFVNAESHRLQHYCLTQFAAWSTTPTELAVGDFYRFEGHVNGMKFQSETHGETHINKIMVSKLWKPV
jgi:hypothetical protein